MERRVRLVAGVLILTVVLSLAAPLALTLADRRTNALAAERDRQLTRLAQAAASGDAEASAQRYHEVYGEPVLIVDADGRTLATAGDLDVGEPAVDEAIRLGLVGFPTRPLPIVLPWTSRDPLRTVAGTDGREVRTLALTRVDVTTAVGDVRRSWLLLAAVGVFLLVLAAVLTRVVSRWALRPVHALDSTVRSIASGDRGTTVLATGPPELQELVAEFNRMVETVQRSLDDQQRLVADASHQLRNPLAALRLRAETLEAHLPPRGRRTHAGLLREVDRLERLLDQLLSLARAQETATAAAAGRAVAAPTAPLAEVVADRVEAWRPLAHERGQELTETGSPSAAPVRRDDLGQVLDVLVDNALRYAGPGARVTVEALDDAEGLRCVVADDGPGLPGEGWSRATERFWRGTDDGEGTGLGLAIAHEVAASWGGGLVLRSGGDGDGRGTLAEVWLHRGRS